MTDETKKKIVRRSITQTGVPTMFDELVEQGGNYGIELQVTNGNSLYTVTTEVDPDSGQETSIYTPKNCIQVNGKVVIFGTYSYEDPVTLSDATAVIEYFCENTTITADVISQVITRSPEPDPEYEIVGAEQLYIFALGNAEIIYDNTIFVVPPQMELSGVLTKSDGDLNPEEKAED